MYKLVYNCASWNMALYWWQSISITLLCVCVLLEKYCSILASLIFYHFLGWPKCNTFWSVSGYSICADARLSDNNHTSSVYNDCNLATNPYVKCFLQVKIYKWSVIKPVQENAVESLLSIRTLSGTSLIELYTVWVLDSRDRTYTHIKWFISTRN